jgi:hypothetical protein
MPGLGQPRPHRRQIEILQVRLARDLPRGRLRDDAQLRLRLRERRLDIEPRLKPRGLGEQRPHPRILDPQRRRLFEHGRPLIV